MKVRLKDVCDVIKGKTTITKAISGDYPLVVTAENRLSSNEYQFDCNAVCVPLVSATGHGHASIKRIHYQEGKFALGTILAAVIPKSEKILNARYLHIYLSYFKDSIIVPLMKGSANVSLTVKALESVEIELPNIQKQVEIVKMINIIEKKKNKLECNIGIQYETVKSIKAKILELAVQGKLVEQDPNDEPAEVLLERIREEKERLIREKKIKKEKALAEISEEEKTFELPIGWQWSRLIDLGNYKKGPFGSAITKNLFVPKSTNTIKVYEQKNAINKDITLGNYYITEEYFNNKLSGFEVFPGDIIVSCAGTIGETYVVPNGAEKGIINQALMRMKIFKGINIDYFLLYFDYILKKSAKEKSNGSAMKNIPPFAIFKSMIIAIPPLAEQKRIVKKVDSLMLLCDELEKKTEEQKEYSNKLMESAIKEMLQSISNKEEIVSKEIEKEDEISVTIS